MTREMLLPDGAKRRVERFVDVFLEHRTDVSVVVPMAMRDGPATDDGWWPWKAVDSPVQPEDVLRLEARAGAEFPPLFRAYLTHKCLLMTEFCVALPETPFDNPLGQLEVFLDLRNTSFFRDADLLPFGADPDGGGPACFDIASRDSSGDCPVVLVDMGRLEEVGYRGRRVFESFAELLDCVEEEMLSFGE
ncbi:MAG: SMI1/KNR4 family protein [Rubinisphaera brasiliensis]|uniref:SMI1/KNR4 family protein n=1 Tax=Rubinisphaera brasiliensis TaxID=119 RepID=UPI00391B1C76